MSTQVTSRFPYNIKCWHWGWVTTTAMATSAYSWAVWQMFHRIGQAPVPEEFTVETYIKTAAWLCLAFIAFMPGLFGIACIRELTDRMRGRVSREPEH